MIGLRRAWAIASSTLLVAGVENRIANDIDNSDVIPVVIPIVGGGDYDVYPAVPVAGTPNAYSVLAPPTAAIAQLTSPTNAQTQNRPPAASGGSGSQESRPEESGEVLPNPPPISPPIPSPPNPSPAPPASSAEETNPAANASPLPLAPPASDINLPAPASAAADSATIAEVVTSAAPVVPVPVPSSPASDVASSVAEFSSDMTIARSTLLPPASPSSPSPSVPERTVTAAAASASNEASLSSALRSTANTDEMSATSFGGSTVPTTVATVTSTPSSLSPASSSGFATSTESESVETTTGSPGEASSAISTEAPVASEGAAPGNVVSPLFGCLLGGIGAFFWYNHFVAHLNCSFDFFD